MSGRYASYWNAFLYGFVFQMEVSILKTRSKRESCTGKRIVPLIFTIVYVKLPIVPRRTLHPALKRSIVVVAQWNI